MHKDIRHAPPAPVPIKLPQATFSFDPVDRRAAARPVNLLAGRAASVGTGFDLDICRTRSRPAGYRAGPTSAPLGASELGSDSIVRRAATYGIDLGDRDSDWMGARLYLAGIAHHRCASLGSIERIG